MKKSVLERSYGRKINIFEDIGQNLASGTRLFLQFFEVNEETIQFRALKYVLSYLLPYQRPGMIILWNFITFCEICGRKMVISSVTRSNILHYPTKMIKLKVF